QHLAGRCTTELGKENVVDLGPLDTREAILDELGQTSEYLASFANDNRIPGHNFDAISHELKLLKIENTTLEVSGFRRIGRICNTVATHIKFFLKFKEYYPLLFQVSKSITLYPEIQRSIENVIDKFGEIQDSASPALRDIRSQMIAVKAKINQSFASALNSYQAAELLDEIRESVVDNRRVLAVKSMYRKKVRGTVMGTSKTGSIVYIEPEATLRYSRELGNLEFEEREEIQKILNDLTDQIRPFAPHLYTYQDFLVHIDITSAKAKYASDMDALLPEISEKRELFLRDAYHPLLFLSNKYKKEKTYPQTITLHPDNRIIIISVPNAGRKSITLKTIGMLQLMLQSGLLIPVHERSKLCLFENILTDIGDNQSIENHLSTYS